MINDQDKNFAALDDITRIIFGVLTVYGPSNIEMLQDDLHFYYPLDSISDSDLKKLLNSYVKEEQLYKRKGFYSVLPFFIIDTIEKEVEKIDVSYLGDKQFTLEQLFRYSTYEEMIENKEYSKLRKFIEKSIDDKKIAQDLINDLVMAPYFMNNSKKVLEEIKKEIKIELDEEKFTDLYEDYAHNIPRFFLGGYSYAEKREIDFEELHKHKTIEDNLIKNYPKKDDYREFTYEDLIELGKKITKAKIYKIIDSDRILELTINGEKVYTQILGYYGKDIGIIIYKNKDELLQSYHYAISDIRNYPDAMHRMSVIEVCIGDPGGFATAEVLSDMARHNYPEFPSFITLKQNWAPRLVNKQEIQIVGGVLTDLLTYIKNTDLSDISLHLGERNDDSYNIDQLYITEKETLYGGYNDYELGLPFLNFKNKELDSRKANRLLNKYKKHNISICCYIYPSVVENDELPYMFIIRDDDTGMMVDIFLKRVGEMPNIKNHVLDLLNKHSICPNEIRVNNEYTLEIFEEYVDYFGFLEPIIDDELDKIYQDFVANAFEEEDVDFDQLS